MTLAFQTPFCCCCCVIIEMNASTGSHVSRKLRNVQTFQLFNYSFELFQHDCPWVLHLWWSDSVQCFHLLPRVRARVVRCPFEWWSPQPPLSPTPVSQTAAVGDQREPPRFPLVQGLTDCICNFSVTAFICKVRACLIPDALTEPHKRPSYSFIYASPFLTSILSITQNVSLCGVVFDLPAVLTGTKVGVYVCVCVKKPPLLCDPPPLTRAIWGSAFPW